MSAIRSLLFCRRVRLRTFGLARAGAVFSLSAGVSLGFASGAHAQSTPTPSAAVDAVQIAKSLQNAFVAVARTAGPATVRILSVAPAITVLEGDEDNAGFEPLDASGAHHHDSSPRERPLGSGVLIRADGYILTNDHVVEDSPGGKVLVTLSDGSTYTGTVTRDTPSDLAIIKIEAGKPLPFVSMADSADVQVGQWAIAIGSPFNQANTMTTGIVSALHRNRQIADTPPIGDRFYSDLIQTDASINPGNSGGPLLNIDGALIGINVAILTHSGSSSGVAFAIPVTAARRIAEQLIAKGKASHAALGVLPSDIPYYLRARLGTEQGAYITQVPFDTPAARAGIQPGDVITRFGTDTIGNETALLAALGRAEPNARVPITVLRDGKTQIVTATLADATAKRHYGVLPTTETVSTAAHTARQPARELGIAARSLSPANIVLLRLHADAAGLFVSRVVAGSPASDAGLEKGSVILTVGGKAVNSLDSFNADLTSMHSGDVVTLNVLLAPEDGAAAARGVVDILVP